MFDCVESGEVECEGDGDGGDDCEGEGDNTEEKFERNSPRCRRSCTTVLVITSVIVTTSLSNSWHSILFKKND